MVNKMNLKPIFIGLILLGIFFHTPDTYAKNQINQRQYVACGISQDYRSLAYKQDKQWLGFDADICRALAAAFLGNPERFKLIPIKKENIGLIEVMGLAVLPARLNEELRLLGEYIVNQKDILENEMLKKHADWVKSFCGNYEKITAENVNEILEAEVGKVFVHVLEDAGVYKCTEEGRAAFERFIAEL